MKYLTFWMLIAGSLLLAACGAGVASAAGTSAQADCPITPVGDPDSGLTGPEDGLRAFIVNGGVWDMLPVYEDGSIGQKLMWKYPGYDWMEDPQPDFTLTGEIVGGKSYFESHEATNAFHGDLDGSAILTGINFPHAGCWQLTGQYGDSQFSFVVWVEGQ